jgi:hypothetical protein
MIKIATKRHGSAELAEVEKTQKQQLPHQTIMIKEISRKGAKAQRPVIWNQKVHKGHKEKKRFLKYFCFFLRVHCVLSSLNVILLAPLRLCVRHSFTPLSLFVSFCAFLWPVSSLATPFSFDDIEFWSAAGRIGRRW